jgi:hypothetical protein
MGFSFGNALAAITDPHIRACLQRLGAEVHASSSTVSTLVRNSVPVTSYALGSRVLTAGSGLTGGGDLTADRTFTVGAGTGISVAADSVAVDQAFTPTWTGIHTYSAQDVHNAGVSLGTSGRLNSAVVQGSGTSLILLKPTTTQTTAPLASYVHRLDNSAGSTALCTYESQLVELGGNGAGTLSAFLAVNAASTKTYGLYFGPASIQNVGDTIVNIANAVAGAYVKASTSAASTTPLMSAVIGGAFETIRTSTLGADIGDTWACTMRAQASSSSNGNSTRTWARMGGFKVFPAVTAKNFGTFPDVYGGYISQVVSAAATTGLVITNAYGLYIEEQTRGGTINNGIFLANATSGRKLIALADQNSYITAVNAGTATMDVVSTTLNLNSTNLSFYGVTAAARPSAYTQTYSTASKTHPNMTAAAVGTTASTNITPYGYTTNTQADAIVTAINALITDVTDLKKVVNSIIDDGQALGLLQ